MLPVISSSQHSFVVVQLVGDGRPINLHGGREDDEVVPLRHNFEEKVDMRPFVNKKSHRMPVNGDFENKIRRGAGSHGWPQDAVME